MKLRNRDQENIHQHVASIVGAFALIFLPFLPNRTHAQIDARFQLIEDRIQRPSQLAYSIVDDADFLVLHLSLGRFDYGFTTNDWPPMEKYFVDAYRAITNNAPLAIWCDEEWREIRSVGVWPSLMERVVGQKEFSTMILIPLATNGVEQLKTVRTSVRSIPLPTYDPSKQYLYRTMSPSVSLVSDPERHRSNILQRATGEIKGIMQASGNAASFRMNGMNGNVQCARISEVGVIFYLPLSVEIVPK